MTADGSDRSFGAPRFDVVLRGYDRRQVDDHLSRLNRILGRMRSDLESARSQPVVPPGPLGPPTPAGGRPRPRPRPRPDGQPVDGPDVVGTFTDRMQTILQSAEEEAADIRAKARAAARAEEERLAASRAAARGEEEAARAALTNLVRQRDAVLADLTRMRGQLEALLSGPTARISVPTQDSGTAAAARRDAGAGQPLPGASATPEADASPDARSTPAAADRVSGPTGTAFLDPAGAGDASATTAVSATGGVRPEPHGGTEPVSGTADAAAPEDRDADTAAPAAAEQTTVTASPAAERAVEQTIVAPAPPVEQTAVVSPAVEATDDAEPDASAAPDDTPPGEATVKVTAVERRTAAGDEPRASDGAGNDDREPAQTGHASASRSG